MKKTLHIEKIVEPGQGPVISEMTNSGQEAPPTGSKNEAGWPVLPDSLERFILRRRIDSYHKIWFLLFLHQHAEQRQINREYIRQVTFTDAPTLDEAIEELEEAGLSTAAGKVLNLEDAADVRCELDTMALVFEDPTGRQELLRRLYRHAAKRLQGEQGVPRNCPPERSACRR